MSKSWNAIFESDTCFFLVKMQGVSFYTTAFLKTIWDYHHHESENTENSTTALQTRWFFFPQNTLHNAKTSTRWKMPWNNIVLLWTQWKSQWSFKIACKTFGFLVESFGEGRILANSPWHCDALYWEVGCNQIEILAFYVKRPHEILCPVDHWVILES